MTNPVTNSNMPWWGIVIIIVALLLIFAIIPWKRIFSKKDKEEINKENKPKKIIKENNKPIWGLYNGFGKKQAIRTKTYIYVEEKEDSCSLCRPFENTVLCVDEYAKDVLTMSEAVSKGYHHIGCSHVDIDYFPDTTQIPKNKWTIEHKNQKFKLRLDQFKFEDEIRKIKYNIEESLDKKEINELEIKLNKLDVKYKKFLRENNMTRREDKEEINIPEHEKFI